MDNLKIYALADEASENIDRQIVAMKRNGLITWSIGSPIGKIGITEDFDAHLDKLKHTLEIANILGAKNTRLQVQTIALHCGIMDVQYFPKLFKKQTGKTPREYRESMR